MRAQIARVSLRRPPTCDAAHTHTHKRERANPPPLTLTPKHPHPSCGRPAYFVSGRCASMSLCKPRVLPYYKRFYVVASINRRRIQIKS